MPIVNKVVAGLVLATFAYVVGFFVDFQNLKGAVHEIDFRVSRIENEQENSQQILKVIKELQCENAIFLYREERETETILRHCRK